MDELARQAGVVVTRAKPVARLLLQCDPDSGSAMLAAAGLDAPPAALRSRERDGWSALALAPGEWWLIGPSGEADAMVARIAKAEVAHSLVDISDRNLSLRVEGPGAAALLNAGCPLDLANAAFPAGACSRTLLGKLPILLWRPKHAPIYFVEYFRSFDDYAVAFIRTAAQDLPAETGEGKA